MENALTPRKGSHRPGQEFFDRTPLGTPKPQASSTVDRRCKNELTHLDPPPVAPIVKEETHSPAFLVNAINGMRQLTDQLDFLEAGSGDIGKMPPPTVPPPKGYAGTPSLPHSRRESFATESEANSSLGILKLDNMQGFSEAEDMGDDVSKIIDGIRNKSVSASYRSLLHKEFMGPTQTCDANNSASGETFMESLHTKHPAVKPLEERHVLGDISDQIGNCGADGRLSSISSFSSTSSNRDLKADLRLRMQRALAKRTIDRSSSSSVRMSQLSDLLDDSAVSLYSNLSSGDISNFHLPESADVVVGNSSQTPKSSRSSSGPFSSENFPFSLNGSQVDSLSSESFQPAEAAMMRLDQDERSWRKQYDVIPVQPAGTDKALDSNSIQHLTHNLELSSFSGIISGEVTVSPSVLEGTEKRRLSMGEYFGLRTERLGGVADKCPDEERPNFGKAIKSPPRVRPHPPLVEIMSTQDVSLDEVPTRDSGLNVVLNSSFGDTLEFTASGESLDSTHHSYRSDVQDPSARSIDLMPPPAPRSQKNQHEVPVGASPRDSLSSRLSTSLCLPRNTGAPLVTDLDMSSVSMDSGERRSSGVASISQIANLLSEMPGTLSSRSLVDNLMKGFASIKPKVRKSSNENRAAASSRSSAHEKSRAPSRMVSGSPAKPPNTSRGQDTKTSTVENRVSEWVSALNINSEESVVSLDVESITPSECGGESARDTEKATMPPPAAHSHRHHRRSADVGGHHRRPLVGDHNAVRSKSVSAPLRRGQAPAGTSTAYDGDESDTSFMAPPVNGKLPINPVQRLHSTPRNSRNIQDDTQADRRSVNSNKSENDRRSVTSNKSENDRRSVTSNKSENESRAPSACGSLKNSSRRTDSGSVSSVCPLQVESTHTQLSWACVVPGSSVTQVFALRNKASLRVRLLVSSTNPTFKLMGERGEVVTELPLTLHSEETRRIHVLFTPSSVGPSFGKLVVRKMTTSESSSASSGDRRLIPLYGYCGTASVVVDGASKDQWAQLFVSVKWSEGDDHNEESDVDSTSVIPQMGSSFFVRNTGSVAAYVSVQVAAHEVPFADCGVSVTPPQLLLAPGKASRVTVHFEPKHDVLQWLLTHAGDMQLLANLWLSWSELATWQRIRRLYLKHYGGGSTGPLASWGPLYTGDLGVAEELRDKQSAETVLVQGIRRIKMAVLGEHDQLQMFDLDATMVFQQLVANETVMLNSPPVDGDVIHNSTVAEDSPLLAGNLDGLRRNRSLVDSPSGRPGSKGRANLGKIQDPQDRGNLTGRNLSAQNFASSADERDPVKVEGNTELVSASALPVLSDYYTVEFPPTLVGHKSCAKVTIKNTSLEKHHVSVRGAIEPFTVATPEFDIQGHWYLNLRLFFKPFAPGPNTCSLQVFINGKHSLNYDLKGEGIGAPSHP